MADVWSILDPAGLSIPESARATIVEAVRRKRPRSPPSREDVLAVLCGSPLALWAPWDRGVLPAGLEAALKRVLPPSPAVLLEVLSAVNTSEPQLRAPPLLETSNFSAAGEGADDQGDGDEGDSHQRLLKLLLVDAKGTRCAAIDDTAHTSSMRAPGGTAGAAQPRSPAAGPDIDFDLEEDDEDAEALAALAEAEAAEATATAQRHGGASSSSSSSSAVSLGGDAGDDSRSGDLARATGGAEDGLDDVDVDWAALDDFDDEEEHDDPATPVIALDDDPQLPGGDGGRPAQGTDDADDDGEGGRLSGATDDPRRSSAAPALSASQPWTERAVTFSGLRVDVSGGGVAKLSAAIASGADTRQAVLSPAALAALTGLPAAAASNALRSIASMPKPAELPLVARLAASLAAFRGDAELVELGHWLLFYGTGITAAFVGQTVAHQFLQPNEALPTEAAAQKREHEQSGSPAEPAFSSRDESRA
ncbi:hypothetical protein FNF27_02437 [Cafeteria roenbergensis]|uniref:Uncharacterized protein n=1 Tax=Cafeteria roenbergensis TaxID=33653 RepID=A0A5A8EDU5_CAFRO|nr:hypothetical protein FNF27_02437 [Cafeteria roenbergensis]